MAIALPIKVEHRTVVNIREWVFIILAPEKLMKDARCRKHLFGSAH
jgi:hypothetical protein